MKLVVVFVAMLSLKAQASIWIRGPGVSAREFREFVAADAGAQTLIQYELSKRRIEDPSPEELRWAQSLLEQENIETIRVRLDEFITADTMTERRRIFLIDLLLKVRERTKGNTRREVEASLCQWSTFPNSSFGYQEIPIVCPPSASSLEKVRRQNPDVDYLLVEDFGIALKDGASAPVSSDKPYNWFLLSNSGKRVSFQGTLHELEGKNLRLDPIVKGDCGSFTHQVDDLELIGDGRVYFGRDCQKDLQAPETSRIAQWYEENRPWVIPVGLAIVGAAALGLKNKKVILEKPAFH